MDDYVDNHGNRLLLREPRYFVEHPGYVPVGPLSWCDGCDRIMASTVGHVLVCQWRPEKMTVVVVPLRYMSKINVSIDFANPTESAACRT